MKDVEYYLDNLAFFQPLAFVEDETLEDFRPDGWAVPDTKLHGQSWDSPHVIRCCRLCGDELTEANQLNRDNRTCRPCLLELREKAERQEVLVDLGR
jgi:hypothetical protein